MGTLATMLVNQQINTFQERCMTTVTVDIEDAV